MAGSIEFLQQCPVVAVYVLLEIGTAGIPAVLSLYVHVIDKSFLCPEIELDQI
jgi:Na+/H+-dicarboxylate symporter